MAILEDKKKIDIVDIMALRPELMEISEAEFERRWAEMTIAKNERDRLKKEKEEEAKKVINNAIKVRFALACSEMLDADLLPDWVDVAKVTDKNGVVNFFRSLKVAKPQD